MIPATYLNSNSLPQQHAGLSRVIAGAAWVNLMVACTPITKSIRRVVTAVGTMAAIVAAERVLESAQTGFWAELVILSAVALLAYGLIRVTVVPVLATAARALRGVRRTARVAKQTRMQAAMATLNPQGAAELTTQAAMQAPHSALSQERARRNPADLHVMNVLADPFSVGMMGQR